MSHRTNRTRWIVAPLGLAALLLAGCPAEPGCADDGGCAAGELCVAGVCEPAPAPGGCVDDSLCADGEHCVEAVCTPLFGDPLTCPAPPLAEELVCSDWDPSECPCYAGVISFHEKVVDGRASCNGIVDPFPRYLYLTQSGCHFTDPDAQLAGDFFGFGGGSGEIKLNMAKIPNDGSCSATPDRWFPEGSLDGHPAIRITCSATCKFWMEQLPMPSEERLVPDGSFVMGTPAEQLPAGRPDEGPAGTVAVTCHYMDRFEVSRGAYRECLSSGGCTQPDYAAAGEEEALFFRGENAGLPMVAVTHQQARAFCAFHEKSLPTEAEWERAARSDPALFEPWPWGAEPPFTPDGQPDCGRAVFAGCGAGPAPVGADAGGRGRGTSYFGVADLGGNVREWTRDYYLADSHERLAGGQQRNPEVLAPGPLGTLRVVRGGGFHSEVDRGARPPSDALRVSARDQVPEGAAFPDLGFRCVRYRPGVAR